MYVEQTDSTNSLMTRLLRGEEQQFASCLQEDIPLLYTGFQTSGRGQTGNGWESERGKNLLLTYLLREPKVNVTEQFRLNILASVVTHRTITAYLPENRRDSLTVKWPNDIYVGDSKIAGILVENSLTGSKIQHSIAGIGINLNQEHWIGGAPNPVSLKQLTGLDYNLHELVQLFMTMLSFTLTWSAEQCRDYYMQHLYRRNGYWPFAEREVSSTPSRIVRTEEGAKTFQARIADIQNDGCIVLQKADDTVHTYHFKQIQFVL
ncbi:MAG: biotin--[Paludibacteraceae bacterium]|nr:biotin--[acetyl-CoA-carboxylase] ligase [Paludibacteraceae bacterium]